MMIIGIGNDLCDCRRIESVIQKHGERFLNRIFNQKEQSRSFQKNNPIPGFAKLFSAKEAVAKALGTGFTKGVRWKDIEIGRIPGHAPYVLLHHNAYREFQRRTPPFMKGEMHLSITDEWPYAYSFAIFSVIPSLDQKELS